MSTTDTTTWWGSNMTNIEAEREIVESALNLRRATLEMDRLWDAWNKAGKLRNSPEFAAWQAAHKTVSEAQVRARDAADALIRQRADHKTVTMRAVKLECRA